MAQLKDKQYYSDLYDRITVEKCRWIENFHKNYQPPQEIAEKASKEDLEHVKVVALRLDLFTATGERYLKKKEAIREWVARDTAKDEFFDSAKAPENICCLKCGRLMSSTFKDLYDWGSDGKDRVLFMYDCPNKCLPRRAFFNDGEEWKVKPRTESIDEELKLPVQEKKVNDKNFEKDRARFCLTEEQGQEYLKAKTQWEDMKKLVDEWEERDKNKEVYDKVAKLKKLTGIELERLLTPALEKDGYVSLQLANPEIDRNVIVPFTLKDSKSGRESRASEYELKRLLKTVLEDTNWRPMSDGVSYRLGFLSGRLRGYEKEEDLIQLVKVKI